MLSKKEHSAKNDKEWFKPEFDDLTWKKGINGAGYEAGQGFEKLISPNFNFIDQMHHKATSLYLRFPFEIKNLDENFVQVPGMSGATIMGDGKVSFILDVATVMN